jgi:hypothetical protein
MREGNSLDGGESQRRLAMAGNAEKTISCGSAAMQRGVNSLQNPAIVADIMLTTYAESITYRRKREEVWMESATSLIFYAKRMIMKGIIRRHAGIWRKNRRQFGDNSATRILKVGGAARKCTLKPHGQIAVLKKAC